MILSDLLGLPVLDDAGAGSARWWTRGSFSTGRRTGRSLRRDCTVSSSARTRTARSTGTNGRAWMRLR